MSGNDEQEATPVSLAELDQVLHTFEHAAARARWNDEGKSVVTLARPERAENVKAACRELIIIRRSYLCSTCAKRLVYLES
jgi:hypothetical protein